MNKTYRIVCTKKHEKDLINYISKLDCSILNRYNRGLIIIELTFQDNFNSTTLKKLVDLQDKLLNLS